MNEIAFAVLIIFAVIGIIYFVKDITTFNFHSCPECSIVMITPINAQSANAEIIIRNYAEKLKWITRGNNNCVLCVDVDMDKETEQICSILCKEYGFIKLIKKSEINDFLNNEKDYC